MRSNLSLLALILATSFLLLQLPINFTDAQKANEDTIPPTITLISPANGTITNQNITLIYSVYDNVDSLNKINITGPENNTVYTKEGNYKITITATDSSNNTAWLNISFTIDRTLPSIIILNVADGAYYNKDITPVIVVADANLNISSVTLNGEAFTSGTRIRDEGNYALKVEAIDKANNTATKTIYFVTDRTPPANVTNIRTINIGATSITLAWNVSVEEDFFKYEIWSARDENFSAEELIANFTGRNITSYEIKDLTSSTTYYFKIKVTDKAGNEAQSIANFTTLPKEPVLDLSLIGIICAEVVIIIFLALVISRKLKIGKKLKKL